MKVIIKAAATQNSETSEMFFKDRTESIIETDYSAVGTINNKMDL
jgi:hypothetical protein